MPGCQQILRGRTFVHSKPAIAHFPFLDRFFDHVAHVENNKKVQKNNGQYRIENERVIHEGNLTIKPINKKPRDQRGLLFLTGAKSYIPHTLLGSSRIPKSLDDILTKFGLLPTPLKRSLST